MRPNASTSPKLRLAALVVFAFNAIYFPEFFLTRDQLAVGREEEERREGEHAQRPALSPRVAVHAIRSRDG